MKRKLVGVVLMLSLVAAACGSDDDSTTAADEETTTTADGETTTTAGEETTTTADEETTTTADGEATCETLPLKNEGVLTVATGEPVFPPWMEDDDPSNRRGFESALVYALAEELGVEDVEWTRTGFDQAIAPGEKSYDFNIQQYSITPERDEVVDFSTGYYQVEQAVIGAADSPIASASSVADLVDARLGAAIGTTSLDYIDEVIQPSTEAAVFDDNVAAKSAFDANQIDGIVFDLPTAYFVTAVEIEGSEILGVLPVTGEPEELGMLFEEGSPLVPCVNEALETLDGDGTLDALEDEWLNQGGSIPSLTP